MDESTPPVKSSLSEALRGSKKAAECAPETPSTPDATATLAVPSPPSSLNSSESEMAVAASAQFTLSDLPDDLLLKILMLVDEPTRQFAVHRVSSTGRDCLSRVAEISSTSTLTPFSLSPPLDLKKKKKNFKKLHQQLKKTPGLPLLALPDGLPLVPALPLCRRRRRRLSPGFHRGLLGRRRARGRRARVWGLRRRGERGLRGPPRGRLLRERGLWRRPAGRRLLLLLFFAPPQERRQAPGRLEQRRPHHRLLPPRRGPRGDGLLLDAAGEPEGAAAAARAVPRRRERSRRRRGHGPGGQAEAGPGGAVQVAPNEEGRGPVSFFFFF